MWRYGMPMRVHVHIKEPVNVFWDVPGLRNLSEWRSKRLWEAAESIQVSKVEPNPTLWEKHLMREPLGINLWHDPTVSCPCVGDHNPNPTTFDEHHIVPLAWDGPDEDSNLIILCPTTHRNVHLLLNAWKREGGEPAWKFRQKFSPFVRELAERGWREWFASQELTIT